MLDMSRRTFLKTSLGGACAMAASPWDRVAGAADAKSSGLLEHAGVALYTVRDQMQADPAGTLKAIAALGYRYVEGGFRPALGPALSVAGLKQASAYLPTYLVTGNRQAWAQGGDLLPESYTLDNAIAEAKDRGLEYLVVVYLQKAERGGLDVYRDLAARLNRTGEACRKAGLRLAYHPHAFEYEAIDGVRPIDLLLKETGSENLALELDTFWASIAGQDPVAMLETHKGRVPLVHLKDKAKGTPVQYDEGKVPKGAFKEVGRGEVDFPAFLKLAASAGVRYYYVEQDWWEGSTPLDSLRVSHAALEAIATGKTAAPKA
jgi:sugar phosphate isomerase/epimerase